MSWRQIAYMKRHQRDTTITCMNIAGFSNLPGPLIVTITRIGPRKLDDDNLAAACKYVRDAIAAKVGIDDGSDYYEWVYRQKKGKTDEYRVDIEIIQRTY